jgi:uncharacterized damage-inducible protein DinB
VAETLERISALIATTPRRWLDLAAAVPDEALERPAAAGEWSAVDCLRHLLQAERHVFPVRVEQFLTGSEMLSPVDPSAIPRPPETTARELAEAFARAREENLTTFSSLRPEDLERPATSRRLGRITLRDLMLQWAVHDLDHLAQAERALAEGLLAESPQLEAAYAERNT